MFRGVLSVLLTCAFVASAAAQSETANRGSSQSAGYSRANQGTVGIISGNIDSTAIHAASDMSQVLDVENKLRVVPVVGRGSVQNITDLLYLKGIDLGIVQSDVLSYFQRSQRYPGIRKRVHYITKLYNEEFHVLSRMKYLCIDDLGGRRVNFGDKESGTAMTAQAVFKAHGVQVERFFYDQAEALAKLKKGDLDAIVFVAGKPARAFEAVSFRDKVHFLDVTYEGNLQEDYLPAVLSHDDYPDLISPKEKVTTIAVGSVLAVYNWPKDSTRYRKVDGFISAFFSKFDKFKSGARHPKWKEVNLNSQVAGWTRFRAARNWLKRSGADGRRRRGTAARVVSSSGSKSRNDFKKFLRSIGGDINSMSSKQKEALFKQFMRWQNNR